MPQPDKRDAKAARYLEFGRRLTDAIDNSGMAKVEIVRAAVRAGADVSPTTLLNYRQGINAPRDPETVWALEIVLGCDGYLTEPLGLVPASQAKSINPQTVELLQDAVGSTEPRADREDPRSGRGSRKGSRPGQKGER